MKLNNLSRLTALLLALTMILPTFAVAEDGTAIGDLTATKLAQMASAEEMIAAGKCSICAGEVTNLNILEWPVAEANCLHAYLGTLAAPAAYEMLLALYDAKSSLYDAYINAHQKHVRDNGAQWTICYDECAAYGGYKVAAPGPTHTQGTCPWWQETAYVPSQTLTDATTGITVTGEIPAGVTLTVNQVGAAVDDVLSMINLEDYAEVPTVLRYDITLTKDGIAWQPTTPVTVKVPDVYETVPTDPLAEVIHMTSAVAAGYEKLANVTVNADRSVTFDATGFSTYYVVAGTSDGSSDYDTTIRELPGEDSTYYVQPGTVISFTSGTFSGSGSTNITRNGRVITVSANAFIGETAKFTVGRYTLTFIVSDLQTIISNSITTQPVYLSINTSGKIPGEPSTAEDIDYKRLNASYTANSWIQWEGYTFASIASEIIDPAILSVLEGSVDGSSTVGVADATGTKCQNYILSGIDWNKMMDVAVQQRAYATDGKRVTNDTRDNYIIVPYVIKFMAEKGIGWHIDCAVVPAKRITLQYDLNLQNYTVSATLGIPNAVTDTDGQIDTKVGSISGLKNNTVTATLTGDPDINKSYELTFKGWATEPNATTHIYQPNDPISVKEDTVLYAVWESNANVGRLTITKDVIGIEDNTVKYDFTIVRDGTTQTWYERLSDGESATIDALWPGNYIVTEIPVVHDGYALSGVRATNNGNTTPLEDSGEGKYSYEVEVIANAEATVTFTNVYELDVADLTITKVVVGAPAGIAEQEFAITVSLPEKAEEYTYIKTLADKSTQEGTLTTNGGTLNIKNGETIVIKDVAIGSKYSVTETEPSYFTVTGEVENAQIANGENKVNLTNAYKSGQLSITKTVQAAENVDVSKDVFTFTVTLDPAVTGSFDYTVNGSTHTATFTNGIATITLKAGETATFETLPNGVEYTVTEQLLAGYVLDEAKTSGTEGKITNGTPASAVFTNIHQFGNLVISKTVSGEDAPGGEFVFNITLNDTTINDTYGAAKFSNGVATITLKNGETATIVGLPSGVTYTVEEVAVPGYTTEATGASGTIVDAGTQTVEFINTYSVGNLSITKNVVGNTAPSDVPFSFVVNFTPIENIPLAESYNYVITSVVDGTTKQEGTGKVADGGSITLQNGQTATISGIQAGVDYKVTETEETGFPYTVTQTGNTGTIAANTTQAAVFTNTYTKGDLAITKEVSGVGADSSKCFDFTVTLPGMTGNVTYLIGSETKSATLTNNQFKLQLKHGETAIIKDIPADTKCTVTETAAAGYATKVNGEEALSSEATIVAGGVANIAFNNTYSVADLTITKKVVPETNVTAPADAFTITVNLTAGANAVLADDYTVKVDNAVLKSKYTLAANKQTATLVFDLVDGQTATIVCLQVNTTYTVVETEKAYYTAAYDPSTIATKAKEIVSGTNTVTVTNSYNTGNLTVTKQVVGTFAPKGEQSETFKFTLTLKDNGNTVTPPITVNNQKVNWSDGVYVFTLKDGDSITIYGIPDGVTYTVTEVQPEGFDYTTEVNDAAGNTATGTANNDPTVTFTNIYKYSQLTITKDVSDDTPTDLAAQEFKLTVTLPNGGSYPYTVNGTAATTLLNGGENQLTIKNNQRIVIDKLPIDEAFSVTEDEPTYFNVNGEVSNVKIDDAGNTVAITNTYKPGSLTITKVVQAASGVTVPADDEFEFMVTLTGMTDKSFAANVTGLTNETTLTFSAGIASFKMKAGESVTITNLPAGVFYTVTEAAHPDYELTAKTGDTGTITEAEATANFTNTYQYSDLKISKTVVNASELYKDDLTAVPFTFTVTLGNGTSPSDLKYQIGNAAEQAFNGTITLKAGETATIKNIPVGTTYTVAETPVAGYTTKVAKNNSTPVDRTAEEGTIAVNTVDTVAFTNTYSVGQLVVTKTVVDKSGMGYDLTKDVFTFTVNFSDTVNAYTYTRSDNTTGTITGTGTITLKHGETATFDRIPAGVIYRVTESETMPCVGYKLTASENTTGEIGADKTSAATFENTYCTGTLTIIKTGMQGDESAIFTVNARTKDHPEGRDYTIALSNNESVTIKGLVLESSYSVTENGGWSNRYDVTSTTKSSDKIEENGTTVTITNEKKNNQWLHDEYSVHNDFSKDGKYQ